MRATVVVLFVPFLCFWAGFLYTRNGAAGVIVLLLAVIGAHYFENGDISD